LGYGPAAFLVPTNNLFIGLLQSYTNILYLQEKSEKSYIFIL